MSSASEPRAERDEVGGRTARPGRRDGRFPSVATSVELARVQLRRGYRGIWSQDFWLLFIALSGLAFLFALWLAFDLSRTVGAGLAAGEPVPSGTWVAWSVLWVFVTCLLIWTGVSAESDLDNDGHYLTIRPVADVVGGVLVASACTFSLYVLLPGVASGVGLAVGTGSPLPVLGALAAAVVVASTTVAVGYPIGLALKGTIRRSNVLARLKPIIGLGVGLGYVVLVTTGDWLAAVDAVEPLLVSPPLSWLGDLALVTTPGADVDALGAAGAVLFGLLVTVVGVVLSVPIARFAWLADRTLPVDDEDDVEAPAHRVDALLEVVCRRPATLGIASTTLVRAYRAPYQLVFVAFPLLAVIPLAEGLIATGTLPWYAPWFVVWYGAWAAGAVVPLNPLGNQGVTLPALLTAPADARRVVHGHVVAAAVPIAPLTAALAVGAGYLAGRPGTELVALGLASVAAVVAGAVLATGIGSAFPRFDGIGFAGSRRAVPPSKVAYGAFSTVLSLTVVAVAVVVDNLALEITAVVLSAWLPFGLEVSTGALTTAGWLVLGLAAVAVPACYSVALRRIAGYRLD